MTSRQRFYKKGATLALAAIPLAILALPGLALAEEAAEKAPEFVSVMNGNTVWTLIAATLVMFMQAGFAMVETGLTRAKNAGNILMKNMFDFAAGSIAFFLFGYALMFGTDLGGFIGTSNFGLSEATAGTPDGLWAYTYWFFQCVFAATAVTIVSGAIAERTKFVSYLILSFIVTALIYPVSGHWIWGGGWLSKLSAPMIDFAGSTVVHSVGGWISLAGAMDRHHRLPGQPLQPRLGQPAEKRQGPQHHHPGRLIHHMPPTGTVPGQGKQDHAILIGINAPDVCPR